MALAIVLGLALAGATIEWSAPHECVSPAEMTERFEGRKFEGNARIDALVTRSRRGLRLELRVVDDNILLGQRRVEALRCADLEAATLFIAGLVLRTNPSAQPHLTDALPTETERDVNDAQSVSKEPARETEAEVAGASPPLRSAIVTESAEERRLHGNGRLGALVDLGTFPHLSPGVESRMGVRFSSLRLEIGARFLAPASATSAVASSMGGRFTLLAGVLAGCGHIVESIAVCVGGELGLIWATGYGVTRPTESRVSHRALSLSVLGVWPVGFVKVFSELGIAASLARPQFRLDGVGDIHRAAPVSARFSLGVDADVF